MTLKEWVVKHNRIVDVPLSERPGYFVVGLSPDSEAARDLYQLSDFRVSSLIAGCHWLVPALREQGS